MNSFHAKLLATAGILVGAALSGCSSTTTNDSDAGTGSDASTGGDGGGSDGAASSCPGMDFSTGATACDNCTATNCCNEATTCSLDTDCVAYGDCKQACEDDGDAGATDGGLASCLATCDEVHNGGTTYKAFNDCAIAKCPSECQK